jgi:hypothetical protein
MAEIAVLGVDLGKNSCSVVGLDAAGRVVLRRRLHRDGLVRLAAASPGCVVAMGRLVHSPSLTEPCRSERRPSP